MRFTLVRACLGALLCMLAVAALSGTAGATPKPQKPSKPTALTAVAVDKAISLSWSAPAPFTGPPVLSYVVKVTPGAEPCAMTSATSCLITGLSNTKKYKVKVQAVNALGAGKVAQVNHVAPNTTRNCSYVGPYGNLQNCSFFNEDLSGDNLSYANMTGADLSQATVDGVDFNGTVLSGTSIGYLYQNGTIIGTPASLPSGGAFAGGYILGPGIYLTNVSGTALTDINFTGTGLSLAGAVVQGDNFSGDTFPATTDFASTDMVGDTLVGTDLAGADLSGLATSSLNYLDMSGADLANTNLSGINLLQDDIDGVNLTGTDLNGASINGLVQDGGIIGTPANLPAGNLVVGGWILGPGQYLQAVSGTPFANQTFSSGLALNNSVVQSDDLNGDTFASGTDFSNGSVAGSTFENDSLIDADFSGSNASYADFTGADLLGANFAGANTGSDLWSDTICPDGTNSDDDGSTCVNNLG